MLARGKTPQGVKSVGRHRPRSRRRHPRRRDGTTVPAPAVPIRRFRDSAQRPAVRRSRSRKRRGPGAPNWGVDRFAVPDSTVRFAAARHTDTCEFSTRTPGESTTQIFDGPNRFYRSVEKMFRRLKLGDFGEAKIADLHCRHDHLERFFARRAYCWTQKLNIAQHFEDALVEAEIAHRSGDAAFLHEEETIARHPGKNFFVRVYFPDVPKPRDKQPAFGGANHVIEVGFVTGEDQIHRRLAVFVGQRKSMPRRFLVRPPCRITRIDEVFRNAAVHQKNALPGQAFPIERHTKLERMVHVVADGDVFAEDLFAYAAIQAGALVFKGGRSEIIEEKTDEIE